MWRVVSDDCDYDESGLHALGFYVYECDEEKEHVERLSFLRRHCTCSESERLLGSSCGSLARLRALRDSDSPISGVRSRRHRDHRRGPDGGPASPTRAERLCGSAVEATAYELAAEWAAMLGSGPVSDQLSVFVGARASVITPGTDPLNTHVEGTSALSSAAGLSFAVTPPADCSRKLE